MIEENIGREDGITIELIRLQGIIDSGIDQKIHPKVWHAIEELMSLKKLEFINDCKRRLSSCSQIDALFPFAGQTYRNDIIGMFNKLGKEVSDSLKYAIDNSNVIKYYSIEEFNLSYEREKLRKYLKEQFGEKSIIPDDILNLVIEKDREFVKRMDLEKLPCYCNDIPNNNQNKCQFCILRIKIKKLAGELR